MTDVYAILLKSGLTTSRTDFSAYWAGRAPSYLATTGALSDGAMIAVFRRLLDERRWLLAIRVAHMILFRRPRQPTRRRWHERALARRASRRRWRSHAFL